MLARPSVGAEHHHILSNMLLSRDSELREDVVAFSTGGAMSAKLLQTLAPLFFIPVAERNVEGIHRDVKLNAKFWRLGPARVSLAVRMAEIRKRLQSDEKFFTHLVQKFELARHPRSVAIALGFSHHHFFAAKLQHSEQVDTYEWLQTATAILHRTEGHIAYDSFLKERAAHDLHRRSLKRTSDMLNLKETVAPPRNYEDILKRVVIDEFRRQSGSDTFFTLPIPSKLEEGSYTVTPLLADAGRQRKYIKSDELQQFQNDLPAAASREDEQDESDLQCFLESSTGLLAFRVLHGHPEHLKQVPLPLASSPLFVRQAIVVTIHPVLELNAARDSPWIQLSARVRPVILEGLMTLPLQVLRKDLRVWSLSDQLQYTIDLSRSSSSSLMLRLV